MEFVEKIRNPEKIKKFVWTNRQTILECLLVLFSALWVGKAFINFNANDFVEGREFALSTISHYVWGLIGKCGPCVFWNGYVNGGAPSFIELQGAFFHPLVVISTLLFGVINGAKVIVLVSFIAVAFSQWWLAKELHLGFFPSIWVSIMAVVSGSIFGRMQSGNITLVLSVASASCLLPMFLRLRKVPSKRNIALTALLFALTWLSGQEYIQIVVILAYFPPVLWYLFKKTKPRFDSWLGFACALLLSILVISILLVPFIHFAENWIKPGTKELDSFQPLEYTPLNLVIHDWKFYSNTSLVKNLSPWAHINYVGWGPVLLAIFCLFFLGESRHRREIVLFVFAAILALVFSSREIYIPVENWNFIEQLSYINVAASLAVQPLIMLAGITLQEILDHKWTNITFTISTGNTSYKIPLLKWLVLAMIMFLSIQAPYQEGAKYRVVRHINIYSQDLALLDTDSSQWIGALNNDWIPFLLSKDKKLIISAFWTWKGKDAVYPRLKVIDSSSGADTTGTTKVFGLHNLIEDPKQLYAYIENGESKIPCSARSLGGQIDVDCDSGQGGRLVVQEYSYTGWYAWMDGNPVSLDGTTGFLAVTAISGKHTYEFRYKPWDVYVGMAVSFIGILLCVLLFFSKKTESLKRTDAENSISENE